MLSRCVGRSGAHRWGVDQAAASSPGPATGAAALPLLPAAAQIHFERIPDDSVDKLIAEGEVFWCALCCAAALLHAALRHTALRCCLLR